MAIEVWRGPASTGLAARLEDARIMARQNDEYVAIVFETGGGIRGSQWNLFIASTDFAELAAAMIKADRHRAVRAFGKAQAAIK